MESQSIQNPTMRTSSPFLLVWARHVTCDELQDSILHLLLFSLDINNIREHLLKSFKFSYDLQINMCENLKLERVILLLWKL